MSRPSKPTELLLLEGKSHRTKAELEYREQGERALQVERELQESAQVKADKVAHAEFLRLKRLYSTIEIVSALDQQAINRYCLELSNVARLQDALSQMSGDLAAADDAEARERLYGQMNRTSAAIHKGVELLLKYEDRLFLNPAARIRAVPKTPPKEEKPAGIAAFMAKRAEG
jgi:phage terminase small subunit